MVVVVAVGNEGTARRAVPNIGGPRIVDGTVATCGVVVVVAEVVAVVDVTLVLEVLTASGVGDAAMAAVTVVEE